METQDIIGKEFEFFRYSDLPHLKWGEEYSEWIGSKCVVVLRIHDRYPEATLAEVYPTIGKKFPKHFPTEQIKEQIEKNKRENMSIDDILSEVKQLTSQI
jgi:hypothetical protein